MKIEIIDDKLIVYLRNIFFEGENIKNITGEIRDIFNKLLNYHHINLSGLYEVIAYDNIKYGTILEIIKKDDLFHSSIIDIKVKIIKNKDFYLCTKDYFIFKDKTSVYYDDNYYYINIKEVDNINNIIEFVKIIYNEKDNYLKRKKLLK